MGLISWIKQKVNKVKNWIDEKIFKKKLRRYSILVRVSYKSPRSGHDFKHKYNLRIVTKGRITDDIVKATVENWKQSLLEEIGEPLFNRLEFDVGVVNSDVDKN